MSFDILNNIDLTDVGAMPPDPNKVKRRLLKKMDTAGHYLLCLDNSSTEKQNTCPRSAEYYLVHRRERTASSALIFGGAVHEGLEKHYLGGDQSVVHQSIYDHFKANPPAFSDYRTADRACELLDKYIKNYPINQEPFQIHVVDGKPCVEIPFRVPIGSRNIEVNVPWSEHQIVEDGIETHTTYLKTIHFMWTGKIDMVIKDHRGKTWILDHKTTSIAGNTFFSNFTLAQQMMGYTHAVNSLFWEHMEPCQGLFLNALICRKPTKTGTGFAFDRQKFPYSDAHLAEWKQDVMSIADGFLSNLIKGYFPKVTAWCMGKYGVCPYFDVCQLQPDKREYMLNSDNYGPVTWSPLD